MEVCEICHREILSDEKYKVYQWNRLAHLSCYNKVFWLQIKFYIPMIICLVVGMLMTIFGGISLGEKGEEFGSPLMSSGAASAVLAIGIILLIAAIILAIVFVVKYFAIRKNPPLPDKKDGPFTPTRDNK